MSPAEFAALALHGDVQRVSNVERIKHGLTNESWLVTLGLETVIVRISNPEDVNLQIDRQSEAIILHAVAAAGIGPQVLLCDPSLRVLVTRYLGSTWTDDDARESVNIARLGTVMRQLHSLAPPAGIRRVRLVDVIDEYATTLRFTAEQRSSPLHAQSRFTAGLLDRPEDRPEDQCLCHNDVHALNIVDDGAIRFIDWEYAGCGAPLFDLAAVCVYHGYDEAQRTQLLSSYEQRDEISPEGLERACELFDYIRDLWARVRGTTGSLP